MASADEQDSTWKFFGGTVIAIAVALAYVKFGWQKPAVLELPEKMAASVIAGSASFDLYDLDQPLDVRERALEVVMQQRPDTILDLSPEELNDGILEALYKRRARREARQLSMQWSAYDEALSRPSLRKALERQYRTNDELALKQAMFDRAYRDREFLSKWIDQKFGAVSGDELKAILADVRRAPGMASARPAIQVAIEPGAMIR